MAPARTVEPIIQAGSPWTLVSAGHSTKIYERANFAGEVGASISCAANGARWLHEWGIDVDKGDPVVLKTLINRDWKTGEPVSTYSLDDYEKKWGYPYYMFHRQYMHKILMEHALAKEGDGPPSTLIVNHKCKDIDTSAGEITFENGVTVRHDVIIGADGIGSAVRNIIGIHPAKRPASSSCLPANVDTAKAVRLSLVDYSPKLGTRILRQPPDQEQNRPLPLCNGGRLLSYYCFFPRAKGDYSSQKWTEDDAPVEALLAPYPDLDAQVFKHLSIDEEIRPYPYWVQGKTCIMGDAAHPMMPDQSQGACQAIEDGAALGIIFSEEYYPGSVGEALRLYGRIRKPRATMVQAAAARARENIHERNGFSSNRDNKHYSVADADEKLTIEEMNAYDPFIDIEGKLGGRKDTNGLPENFDELLPKYE